MATNTKCCSTGGTGGKVPPHNHDERYYNKLIIDKLLRDITTKLSPDIFLNGGNPEQLVGKEGDVYINIENPLRPIFKRGSETWEFYANLNEVLEDVKEAATEF